MKSIIVGTNSIFNQKISFLVNSLPNYSVISNYNFVSEIEIEHDINLLIVTLNIENYKSDFLSISKIVNHCPDIMVLLISNSSTIDMISYAYDYKFLAFVDKNHFLSFYEFILENILVFKGFYVSPLFIKYLFEQNQTAKKNLSPVLSKKQNEVAYYLSKGYSYSDIAEVMNVSLNTLRMHVRLLYRKVNIRKRYELNDMLQNGKLKLNQIVNNSNIK